MTQEIVHSLEPVVLFGGGSAEPDVVSRAVLLGNTVTAADGGASLALKNGIVPSVVIGDFDSLSQADRAVLTSAQLVHIEEQDSTDFDKSLRNIAAPLVIAVGFTGARLDHTLATLNTLIAHPDRRCVIVSDQDVIFLAPPKLELDLPIGTRFSLFPMGPVGGHSTGLEWPIAGLQFKPNGRVGTSNRVSGPVCLEIDQPQMLVILPVEFLEYATRALLKCPAQWPARVV
jgi:thiamine pyrophosphokinase